MGGCVSLCVYDTLTETVLHPSFLAVMSLINQVASVLETLWITFGLAGMFIKVQGTCLLCGPLSLGFFFLFKRIYVYGALCIVKRIT